MTQTFPTPLQMAHPWHGVSSLVKDRPELFMAYIETVPSDQLKFEIDKKSGHLMVDRPQTYPSFNPSLYGFIPQTYSHDHMAKFAMDATGLLDLKGDLDPIDICVLTSIGFTAGAILVKARPIGGFRMLDKGEVDDKIIAVLDQDPIFGSLETVSQCETHIIDRLMHYFLSYKQIPKVGAEAKVKILSTYQALEAYEVIKCSQRDYHEYVSSMI